MTLDQFKELFQPILDWNEQYNKEAEALKQLYPSSYVLPESEKILDSYIKLLSLYVQDTDEFIDYYCWECDFGKKPNDVVINGEVHFHLACLGDLWNLIGCINEGKVKV